MTADSISQAQRLEQLLAKLMQRSEPEASVDRNVPIVPNYMRYSLTDLAQITISECELITAVRDGWTEII
jgi:hypothetical protein